MSIDCAESLGMSGRSGFLLLAELFEMVHDDLEERHLAYTWLGMASQFLTVVPNFVVNSRVLGLLAGRLTTMPVDGRLPRSHASFVKR